MGGNENIIAPPPRLRVLPPPPGGSAAEASGKWSSKWGATPRAVGRAEDARAAPEPRRKFPRGDREGECQRPADVPTVRLQTLGAAVSLTVSSGEGKKARRGGGRGRGRSSPPPPAVWPPRVTV